MPNSRKLKPSYFVRGPDYKDVDLPEAEALRQVGCKLVIHPGDKDTIRQTWWR